MDDFVCARLVRWPAWWQAAGTVDLLIRTLQQMGLHRLRGTVCYGRQPHQ